MPWIGLVCGKRIEFFGKRWRVMPVWMPKRYRQSALKIFAHREFFRAVWTREVSRIAFLERLEA